MTSMDNTPDSPAKTPEGYTTQGGNFWTLITPEIWKVLHAVLHACEQILTECLTELGEIFKGIEKLPHEAGFKRVVADTVGLDGRTIRKVVANALASRKEVAVAPAKLTLADIQSAVALAKAARQKGKQ